jgi:hypothetical protein
MGELAVGAPAQSQSGGLTKHALLVAGLRAAAILVGAGDRLDLWQFDNHAELVPAATLAEAALRLQGPRGGTEIGGAIRQVLAGRPTRDVLLITDGKSYALDVQEAARSGRRFHVVLIGEDSLEANVGHLAALTGGQIFVAAGCEVGEMIRLALAAMRTPHVVAPPIEGQPGDLETFIGGMRIHAVWGPHGQVEGRDSTCPVAAVAAGLAIPRMTEMNAAALATAEGIVCHLTSLVLVDEAGATQAGLPAQRKIATMTPRTFVADAPMAAMSRLLSQTFGESRAPVAGSFPGTQSDERIFDIVEELKFQPVMIDLRSAVGVIHWSANPEALRRGDLSGLPEWVVDLLHRAADLPLILALAIDLGVVPLVVAVALLARAEASTNRHAGRLQRAILRGASESTLNTALRAAGL